MTPLRRVLTLGNAMQVYEGVYAVTTVSHEAFHDGDLSCARVTFQSIVSFIGRGNRRTDLDQTRPSRLNRRLGKVATEQAPGVVCMRHTDDECIHAERNEVARGPDTQCPPSSKGEGAQHNVENQQ